MSGFQFTEAGNERMDGPSADSGFRWTCPICATSRLYAFERESGETIATRSLRAHVQASEGHGHGERNVFPEDWDTFDEYEYVVEVPEIDGARRVIHTM